MGERDPILEEGLLPLPSVQTFSVASYLDLDLAAAYDEYAAASHHNDNLAEEHGEQRTLLRCAARSVGGGFWLRCIR